MEKDENKKTHPSLTGAALGAGAGALGTILANPIGRWTIFQAQDAAGLGILRWAESLFHSQAAGNIAYAIFSTITNTIMAFPAILPIAGGILAAGIGALTGKIISKAKLRRGRTHKMKATQLKK